MSYGLAVTIVSDLTRALAELRANTPAMALRTLLSAWRSHRSDRLAALVEQVSDLAETGHSQVEARTIKERLKAALALLAAGAPVDVPRVFRALADINIADALVLVAALAKVPPDPRFLRHIVALLRAPVWGSSTSRKLWRQLFDALVTHGDPRSAAQLLAIDHAPIIDSAYGVEQMNATIARLVKRLTETAPADTAPIAAALAALEAALQTQGAQAGDLLANIYANPNDLALRAIYADSLQERGDPRGELIALQLVADPSAAQRRRERELLDLHGAEWLGTLRVAVTSRHRFTAGFVSDAGVDPDKALAVADAPEWATVCALTLHAQDEPMPWAFLRGPRLRALRFVGGLETPHLADLVATRDPWQLEAIGVRLPNRGVFARAEIDLITRLAKVLPALHEISFYETTPAALAWLWSTPLGRRISRLRVSSDIESVPRWIAADLPAHVTSMEVSYNDGWHAWTCDLTRGADGKLSRLAALLRPSSESYQAAKVTDLIEHVFDELPPDALESFRLRTLTTPTAADLAKVAAAAARQTRAVLDLPTGAKPAPATPALTVKDQRAATAAAADSSARTEYDRAAAQLPAHAAMLRALDLAKPASVTALVEALGKLRKKTADPAWAAICYPILEMPAPRPLHDAAIAALVVMKPAGAAKRILPLCERNGKTAVLLRNELAMIPTAELGQVFDWFETRRGTKHPPRADEVYYTIIALAKANGTAKTRTDLQARLRTRKLGSFVKYAYETAVTSLARR